MYHQSMEINQLMLSKYLLKLFCGLFTFPMAVYFGSHFVCQYSKGASFLTYLTLSIGMRLNCRQQQVFWNMEFVYKNYQDHNCFDLIVVKGVWCKVELFNHRVQIYTYGSVWKQQNSLFKQIKSRRWEVTIHIINVPSRFRWSKCIDFCHLFQ